jgi:hypothetical protein
VSGYVGVHASACDLALVSGVMALAIGVAGLLALGFVGLLEVWALRGRQRRAARRER